MGHMVQTVLETAGAELTLTTLAKSKEARPVFASRIAKAVLNFQKQLLERDANTGSLCQVSFKHNGPPDDLNTKRSRNAQEVGQCWSWGEC